MIALRESQKGIVTNIRNNLNTLIVSPMGSGKTLATLTALTSLIVGEGLKNVLILAPKRPAQSVWVPEALHHGLGLNICFCKRMLDFKTFLHEPTSHHVAVASVTMMEEIPHGCWDMVVVDESTLFGNHASKRSKEARRIMKGVRRRVMLTGTPVHRGYERLWHQIALLDGGEALGKTITKFRETYMRVKYHMPGVTTVWEINPAQIPTLNSRIKHLVYQPKVDVTLPPVFYKTITIDLPAKRLKEYETFATDSVLNFTQEYGTDPFSTSKTLRAFAASARGTKCRQLATGCVYADETNTTYSVTHTEKIDALKDLLEYVEGGVLIAYQFICEYEELKRAFPKARRLDTPDDINAWNRGEITLVLAHAQSLGHGLNLQFGGHTIVWYSPTYDAEIYAQFNARLPRPGQTAEAVTVAGLVARGTIEEQMMRILHSRNTIAEQFKNFNV